MEPFSLTVINPNYNHAALLPACVRSILEQTLIPDEIIIVDDCSTDESWKVICELEKKSPMIRGIHLEKNGGVSNARNTGLQLASSVYVSFIDSDDYYYGRDKLEKEMNLIRKWASRGVDIAAYSENVLVNENGDVLTMPFMIRPMVLQGNIFLDMVARIKINSIPRDYCVKKSIVIQTGGYCYPVDFYEDLDILIRTSRLVRFYVTDTYGTAYRQMNNGLSTRPQEEHDRAVASILKQYYDPLTVPEKAYIQLRKLYWNSGVRIYQWIKYRKSRRKSS